FDHEHVPPAHIEALAADGVTVAPSAAALRYAQDKRAMRERLGELGVPVPRWGSADRADEFGWPVVAKAVRGGYDGRGVWIVDKRGDLPDVEVIVEEKVPLRRELSALVARPPFGQGAAYPVADTDQRVGVCIQVLRP